MPAAGGSSESGCVDDKDCEKHVAPTAECQSNEDCLALGPEYNGGRCASMLCFANPRWRCDLPSAASGPKQLFVKMLDTLSLDIIANVQVSACEESDSSCEKPVANATSTRDGSVTLNVPASFKGYLQHSDSKDYYPTIYALPAVLPQSGKLNDFRLYGASTVSALAVALGRKLDPARGSIVDIFSQDCNGDVLSGVGFSTPQQDMTTISFYIQDQIPTSAAKATQVEGEGGYVSLPAGTAVISAQDSASGLGLGSARVPVRAGFNSLVYLQPSSRER